MIKTNSIEDTSRTQTYDLLIARQPFNITGCVCRSCQDVVTWVQVNRPMATYPQICPISTILRPWFRYVRDLWFKLVRDLEHRNVRYLWNIGVRNVWYRYVRDLLYSGVRDVWYSGNCYFNICLQQGSRDDRVSRDVFSFLFV